MTALSELVGRLQTDVPAVDGVPTSDQYAQAVKDAVAEFSRRCGLTKISSLSIISETASYNMPADFLKLISMDALVGVDGVIVASKLIPISKDFEEEWTIANKQITFYPTPAYTLTRYFKYKAAWVATGEDFTTLGDDEVQIVMLKARAIATEKIYRAQAVSGSQKYSFGAVSVDKSIGTDTLEKDTKRFEDTFADECEKYNGSVLMAG